jgi:glycosyltransferase involved in cell wall biosynthesis
MNCGTPVITSNLTSIPEVVGNAGMLINPHNPNELPNALLTLLNNEPMQEMFSKLGLERAKNFSWENTAKNTLNSYRKVYELE